MHILSKLNSGVLDLWVDSWLFEEYPDSVIHEQRLKYFSMVKTEMAMKISDVNKKDVPDMFFSIVNAMDLAFYRILRHRFVDADFLMEDFRKYPKIIKKAEELAEVTQKSEKSTFVDDVKLIDRWAECLEISDWYHWEPLE